MLLNRRHAVLGLAAAAGGALPLSRALAQTPPAPAGAAATPSVEPADEAATQIGASKDKFEHLLAPVDINGEGPFNFILDTGANVSCVSRTLADRLMLTAAGTTAVHTMVGVKDRPSVMIKTLTVGQRHRRDVKAPALPAFGGSVDGLLGVDWLGGQKLVLDIRQKKIEIMPSRGEHATQNRIIVPCRRKLGQLTIVDAELSGHKISAMIDSGSQVTMCNFPLHELVLTMEAKSRFPKEHIPVKLETIAGEPFSGEMFYLPFLRLGGLELGNVPTVFSPFTEVFDIWGLKTTPALVLGMDLLTQFEAVALDFGRNQVRFDIV
jgi:predicted aspartyl protease